MRKLIPILLTSVALSYAQQNLDSLYVRDLGNLLNENIDIIKGTLFKTQEPLQTKIEVKEIKGKDTTVINYDITVDFVCCPRLKLTAENNSITHTFICGGSNYHFNYNGKYDEYIKKTRSKTTRKKIHGLPYKEYSKVIKIAEPIFEATSENLKTQKLIK